MNNFRVFGHGERAAGLAAAVIATMSVLSAGAAHADTFVPLPDGERSGPGVKITRTGENAVISPSLADNGAGRVAWLSGNVSADIAETPEGTPGPNNGPANGPGSNNSSTHGTSRVSTGYIVGCQVKIAENAITAGVSGSISTTKVGVGGSIGLNLGPGQVTFVEIEAKDIRKPGVYSIEYVSAQVQIQGCVGYAQARAYSVVEIIGNNYSKTSLYGAPFSIG